MTLPVAPAVRIPLGIALVPVLVIQAAMMTWAFLSMREVLAIGGSCAEGGPYVAAQPCPDGTWLLAVAIPVLIVASMVGAGLSLAVSAPNALVVMWGGLFGSLGWNFWEFGLREDTGSAGFIVCGVAFWLMAAPAFGVVATSLLKRAGLLWFAPFVVFLGAGVFLGVWTHDAWGG